MTKPAIPKGTRDFSPIEMARRNYIFSTIRDVFALYGFQQIETPSMELMSTLMGKYGEEGDKLLFRIQNSGDKATEAPEKGLRYDLTVPFARFVVQHRDSLSFPFKRYQIQPVWRADRPQKGRYREFYQCDIDIVGTDSLTAELELIQIVEEVYKRFGIRVAMHINNRKILAGIAEVIGAPEKMTDITVAIDKLDKIGIDKVNGELQERGLTAAQIDALQPIFALSGSNQEQLASLQTILANSPIGLKGIEELNTIFDLYNSVSDTHDSRSFELVLDLTLARGLNYYTGAIFEVKALDAVMGSITGGGRYDNLTGIFGMPGISGVGISFGADRIYDVLADLNLYPESLQTTTQLMFACFGEQEIKFALHTANILRGQGIRCEVYPEPAKIKKQMNYANNLQIPYVAIIGETELAEQKVMLKNMLTGEQTLIPIADISSHIRP